MKVVVTAGDPPHAKVREYTGLTQKGVNSLITGISEMRCAEGFQHLPFTMKVEDEGNFTVVSVSSSMEVLKKLFTGKYEECLDAMKYLINHKGWDFDNLGLLDDRTGRFTSYVLDGLKH